MLYFTAIRRRLSVQQFPGSAQKLLLVDIVERTCRTAVVHEVENIGRCMKIFSDKGEFTVCSLPSSQLANHSYLDSDLLSRKDPTCRACGP